MATAPIEFAGLPTGLTLTATLYPLGSDAAAVSGLTLTERTNAKGIYRTTTTAALTGWHRALVLSGSDVVAIFDVLMDDTTADHYGYEHEHGNAFQTGDAFARIGSAGAGLTALGDTRLANLDAAVSGRASSSALTSLQSDVTTLLGRLTATRAGYLDNLSGGAAATAAALAAEAADVATLVARLTATRAAYLDKLAVSGLVASAADVAGVTQAQRVRVIVPAMLERPDSGSTTYRVWIYAYSPTHVAEALDSNPVVTVENNAGTDRSANLGAVSNPSTGVYSVDYTVADSHAIEGLVFKVAATEGAVTTNYAAASIVVDTTAVDFTAADRTKLDALHDSRLTAPRAALLDNLANLDAAISSRSTYAGADTAGTTTLLARLSSTRAAALDYLDAAITSRLASAGYTAPDNAGIAAAAASADSADTVATAIAALLAEMTEADGPVHRFTANALEAAPAGGGGGGGGLALSDALPATPTAGTVGEALAAALHVARGKKVVVQVSGVWKLRVYRYDDATTVWKEFTIDHPTAPSTVTP